MLPRYLNKIASSNNIPPVDKIFLLTFLTQLTSFLLSFGALTLIMFALGFGNWKPEWASEIFAGLTIIFFIGLIIIYNTYTKFKEKVYKYYNILGK